MVFYTLVLKFYLKIGKSKKEDDTFLKKKNRRKTKFCYYNKIWRWKRDSFPMKFKLQGASFE